MNKGITYDLAIIGGGLSTATFIFSLCEQIRENEYFENTLHIVIFDKTNNFWVGTPYGNLAESDYFLIKTLIETNCPPFKQWILNNKNEMDTLIPNHSFQLSCWKNRNIEKISQGEVDHIYFPRFLFGLFIKDTIKSYLSVTKGKINIVLKNEEAIDFNKHSNKFTIEGAAGSIFLAKKVILATGSIPKKPLLQKTLNNKSILNFISDDGSCACFNLHSRLLDNITEFKKSPHIIIIGAAASALETLYFIESHTKLLSAIEMVSVISTSGVLIGGIYAANADEDNLPDYVPERTSCDLYIQASQRMNESGKLKIIKGKITQLSEAKMGFNVNYTVNNRQGLNNKVHSLNPDIIIDCSGGGTLSNTNSTLLNNLAKKLPINIENRGFIVNKNNQVKNFEHLYILGPLLNTSYGGRQVESISAVFSEGEKVASSITLAELEA